MFALPQTSSVKDKFNWYNWSALVYENDQEVAEAIQQNDCFGKTLREIKVIGETTLSKTNHSRFTKGKNETYVNGVYAVDPIIFEFTDGSTLELLPQQLSLMRIGFNAIPHKVKDGIRPSNGVFAYFFQSFANLFIGKKFVSVEIKTVKHEESLYVFKYLSKEKHKEQNNEFKTYRFIFEGGFTISLSQRRWNDYSISVYIRNSVNTSNPFAEPEVVKFDETFHSLESELDCKNWFYNKYGGYTHVYPDIDEPQTPVEKFLDRQASICCIEEQPVPLLSYFWEKYLNEDEEFEHYGNNYYDYKAMGSMVGDIRGFVDRVENNSMTDEDRIILEDASRMDSHYEYYKTEDGKTEAKWIKPSLMDSFMEHRDYALQFCEYVSAMMRCCPNAKSICIQGP